MPSGFGITKYSWTPKRVGCRVAGMRGRFTHGASGSYAYSVWQHMKNRCLNPNNDRYASYGGRGIKVCERWLKFENFLADMGERPRGTSLDRFPDKDGNYEPTNCRWATPKEQQRNMRSNRLLEHNGITMSVAWWAEHLQINYGTMIARVRRGWSVAKTLETVPKGRMEGRNKR